MESISTRRETGGVRFFAAFIGKDIIEKTAQMHGIDITAAKTAAVTMAIASCIVSSIKENDASVCVAASFPAKGKKYVSIAERDGRVRGFEDETSTGIIKDGVILEVTRKLAVRGDYSSVVTAKDINSAVAEYMKNSQQTVSFSTAGETEDGAFCIIAEQFPITEPKHEIYRFAAQTEWEKILPETKKGNFDVLEEYSVLENMPLVYGCTCSRRKVQQAVISSGVNTETDEDGLAEVKCRYCGKVYKVSV